ncbi:MAG TPA: hypothetical protein PLW99_02290 [Candidatus Paceibacterota bacterium]|nr:MAG: hypothetical protein B7X03_00225 [Parcubacteria group bacterium 21-58-10]HQT82956.1 hypothetical protein [Candidatus Paceibacterota bacterium]
MTFPSSESGHNSLDAAAHQAIEIHNKPEHLLTPEEEKLRSVEHTGIELTGAELAVVRKVIFDWMKDTERKIPILERSLNEATAVNSDSTREELRKLKKELAFLKHNLAEKLFQKVEDTDNRVSI